MIFLCYDTVQLNLAKYPKYHGKVANKVFSIRDRILTINMTVCMCCCCVSVGGALVEVPDIRLDSDPLAPCRGVCGAIICRCGKAEEDDNYTKWEVMKNI